jgi:biofilm PGA synthesis N-glycosyltransferase PgaC
MTRAAVACFWTCVAGCAWVLGGYPAMLALLPPRPWRTGDRLPRVTIVIPAYREREHLRRKLTAIHDLDYPDDRLEVIVAVDEDRELARIAAESYPRARVMFSSQRQGKAAGLNRALAVAGGDVILMTDANNLLAPGSLRAMARHFSDPDVWAVAGRRGESSSVYERYEDLIRRLESRSGSVAAMSGEFMAVRRERVPEFPGEVVNDDFWLLCRIVKAGGRVVYEPAAASYEPPLPSRQELSRRARIGAGRLLQLSEMRDLPAPFGVRVASHKLGRLALPVLLTGAFLSSLSLAHRPAYRAAAGTMLAGALPGLASLAGASPPGALGRIATASREILVGNAGVAIGIVRGIRGRQDVQWEPVR